MDITFGNIDDAYFWARYGAGADFFEIIARTKDGYINANDLAKRAGTKTGKQKDVNTWLEKPKTIELIRTLCKQKKCAYESVVRDVKGNCATAGKYLHPVLTQYLAIWLCPSFAINVTEIIHEHFFRKRIRALEQELAAIKTPPKEPTATPSLMLMFVPKGTEYKIISGRKEYVQSTVRKLHNNGYDAEHTIQFDNVPDVNALFKKIRNKLHPIWFDGNRQILLITADKINLGDMSHDEFSRIVKEAGGACVPK
jgi:hypothetical protein